MVMKKKCTDFGPYPYFPFYVTHKMRNDIKHPIRLDPFKVVKLKYKQLKKSQKY